MKNEHTKELNYTKQELKQKNLEIEHWKIKLNNSEKLIELNRQVGDHLRGNITNIKQKPNNSQNIQNNYEHNNIREKELKEMSTNPLYDMPVKSVINLLVKNLKHITLLIYLTYILYL